MSASPQLTQELSEDLLSGRYECVVCSEHIGHRHEIWACQCCYGVFHLPCIRFWADSQTQERVRQLRSTSGVAAPGELERFRCPLCQSFNTHESLAVYRCYCGKVTRPAVDAMLVPGSCGDPCERRQADPCCPHRCALLCHPGPCPPCTRAREQVCWCGKHSKTVGCSSGIHGFECDETCGKLLDCGQHRCKAPCHEGPCPVCTVMVVERCYCGASERKRRCGAVPADVAGRGAAAAGDDAEGDAGACVTGFRCARRCAKMRDCGHHVCDQPCHPGACEACYRTPERQRFCPCGKSRVRVQRVSCLDPVPSCGLQCELPLPCGHLCRLTCHDETPCAPCNETVTMPCACGHRQVSFPCFCQYLPATMWEAARVQCGLPVGSLPASLPPRCQQVCRQMLSCHKHRCANMCCTDAEHTCLQTCIRKLACGTHQCGQLCHQGPCPPCTHVSYERLYCRCRRSFVEPPVPCGTLPPQCNHPCSIPRPCGHPPNHPCHVEPECPKCVVLEEKLCASHQKPMPFHMPCHKKDVSCGRKCAKHLACCGRFCDLVCHPGPCEHKCSKSFPTLADVLKRGKGGGAP
ncbi:NF-X1 type zinc finger containing protein [Novymonas esmeraldas]|uniref:NF-X1 type zinc finger containing protein n=1 Tax=Novymonas esmeraldas TaxID=1808958 RepID=A0AAW0ERT6_9TRYP